MKDEMDALVSRTAPVRDTDVEKLPLRAAEIELMEEIMATPVLDSVTGSAPPRWRSPRRLTALAGAAAMVAGGVFVVQSGGDDRPAWAAEVVEVAESAPRLLVDGDGWEVTRTDEVTVDMGEMTFANGSDELELSWRPGASYETILGNSLEIAAYDKSVTVVGQEAVLVRYDVPTVEYATVWRQNGYVIEAVGRTFADEDQYTAVLDDLVVSDVDAWLSALPDTVIQPADRESVMADMLADIPTPDGFELGSMPADVLRERYHVGADVTASVTCAWTDQWVAARAAGDTESAAEAEAAMATSHDWAVLEEMDAEGDWPDTIWQHADALANDGLTGDGDAIDTPIDRRYEGDVTAEGDPIGEVVGDPIVPAYVTAFGCE